MASDAGGDGTATRRECLAHGGSVAGGLLAGCSGEGGSGSGQTGTATPSETDTAYTVEVAPAGEVRFERPPERVTHYFPDYADMAVAPGHGDSILSTGLPSRFHTGHYDDFDWTAPRERTKASLALGEHPVGGELTAVENGRIYATGSALQGPIMNLFQLEHSAKQIYPELFGRPPAPGESVPEDGQLFDRRRVAGVVQGDV
jgi:hypothetical protein